MRRLLATIAVLLAASACSGDRREPAPTPRAAGGPPAAESVPARDAVPESAPDSGAAPAPAAAGNTPPEIRHVWFVGGDGRPGNTLGVESETIDPDGDPVRIDIAWRKNGMPAGEGKRLPAPVKRGDKLEVTITPTDGKSHGKPVTLSREIGNTPPGIEGHDQFRFQENIATFHVRASDADGDPLAYSLKDAPAGMSIDRTTGAIRWATSPGTTGRIPFTVTVTDGSGGEATARFTVTIEELAGQDAR